MTVDDAITRSVRASAARRVNWVTEPEAGDELYRAVRAGLALGGTTLHAWCRSNGLDLSYATKAIKGQHNGPSARDLRRRAVEAAGIRMAA